MLVMPLLCVITYEYYEGSGSSKGPNYSIVHIQPATVQKTNKHG